MNHNKLITVGLILTIGVFLAAGCIGEGKKNVSEEGAGKETETTHKKNLPGEAISTCQGLQDIQNNLSANYYLANNIDCSETKNWNNEKGFKPIGGKSYYNRFKGSFDGQGHIISDIYINRPNKTYFGLFEYTDDGAKVANVGLENVKITGRHNVGGLIGENRGDDCNVSNSYVTGTVNSLEGSSGGLIGINFGSVSNSYATVEITGGEDVGGLIANNLGSVSNSYSNSSVNGDENVGGLIGYNKGTVSDSYTTGSVTGEEDVGGLVGDRHNSNTSNSFWNTKISGMNKNTVGTGLTKSEMKSKSTFTDAGWDFQDVWTMDGYPHLQWEK